MELEAIPTTYKGIELKSRMEAQCAVLFDKLGWEWQYEPFSLMLPSGITYIPDFWLPGKSVVVECRGYHSERGDSQLREFGQLAESRDAYVGGHLCAYMAIGPDLVTFHSPIMDGTSAGVIYHCSECGVWSLFPGRPLCHACRKLGTGSVELISISAGKIFINGIPVEAF